MWGTGPSSSRKILLFFRFQIYIIAMKDELPDVFKKACDFVVVFSLFFFLLLVRMKTLLLTVFLF